MKPVLIGVYAFAALILLLAANKHGKLIPPGSKYSFPAAASRMGVMLAFVWWALGWKFV